ncbi:22105_t:CDS:10 [Dentiscutata erythropus]|uniref:22105_t:CDS:1 n=1 Tax=Dentiscutata erythropus TaxID=1348616 RepID=A0A9N9EV08_9GLOM|nr:22105_t:CDS:10 [Dentiscutata erythropus]
MGNVLNNGKISSEEVSSDIIDEDMSSALILYTEELEKKLGDIKKFNYPEFKDRKFVGRGGSAVVYSALYQGEKYALKSLNNNLNLDKKIFKEITHVISLTLDELSKETSVKFIINNPKKVPEETQLILENSNCYQNNTSIELMPEDSQLMSEHFKDCQNNIYNLSKETSAEFIISNPEIAPEDCQLMSKNSKDYQNNPCEPRLLIISHFLPCNIVKTVAGYKIEKSFNGVVDILSELAKSRNFIWIGLPDGDVPEERNKITAQLKESSYYPVFIENSLIKSHDNFSNLTLWTLFHYYSGDKLFCQEDWEAYKFVNGLFADAINEIVQDNDLIWIHGHHLMLLPEMLKKRIGNKKLNVKIGYFLHIPFPSSEIYRILPVCEEILTGVLKSDLVGFQTLDYARHFLSSCTSILGLLTKPNSVYYEDRLLHVGAFPIGIDPERFIGNLNEIEVQRHIKELKEKYKDIKIISSIDQLDYIKGVPQKLHAFDLFLTKHPEWIGKVVFIHVVKPSRWSTEERNNLFNVVNELDGKINGKCSTFNFSPIHFMHYKLSFEELLALYTVSDAFIVTSLRDGMNVLPHQYISCQQKNNGVLILSEFTGSILVNPWNTDEFSNAIYEAVTMNEDLRKFNYQKLHHYVMKHTVSFWGKSFTDKLKCVKGYSSQIVTPHLEINQVVKVANTANKRIILLDYNRTLITHKLAELSNNIISILKALQKKSNTYVYILSGHCKVYLDEQFESTGVGLSAEHGCFYKHPKCLQEKVNPILNHEGKIIMEEYNGWYRLVEQIDPALKEKVLHLFNHYKERTPGASIEKREIGVIWHYCSGPEFGKFGLWQTLGLQDNLISKLGFMPLKTILGDNKLEIRSSLIDQSTVVRAILKDLNVTQDSFVLCIGDESPDEPVFSLLKNDEFKSLNYFTSTVGKKQTDAKFFLEDIRDVQNLLEKLASVLSD